MDNADDDYSSAHPKGVPVILSMKLHATRQQIDEVTTRIEEFGFVRVSLSLLTGISVFSFRSTGNVRSSASSCKVQSGFQCIVLPRVLERASFVSFILRTICLAYPRPIL